jgi:hypothetical protein
VCAPLNLTDGGVQPIEIKGFGENAAGSLHRFGEEIKSIRTRRSDDDCG